MEGNYNILGYKQLLVSCSILYSTLPIQKGFYDFLRLFVTSIWLFKLSEFLSLFLNKFWIFYQEFRNASYQCLPG